MAARLIGPHEVLHRSNDRTREVYLVRSPSGTPSVAASFELDAAEQSALVSEMEQARGLTHRAVTRIEDVFVHESATVVVLEHVTGITLAMLVEHLGEEGERLADGAAMHIVHELLGALLARPPGGAGLVHPRFGLDQVVVSWDGGVKLMGLGLAPLYEAAVARGFVRAERGPFAAPEVRAGEPVQARSNLYTAALMLWALLAQRTPPSDARPEPIAAVRPDLDRALARALDGVLAAAPAARPGACRRLAAVLERRVTDADREELRWNMEVLRALLVVDDLVCAAALPPMRAPAAVSLPPSSEGSLPTQRHEIESDSNEATRRYAMPASRGGASDFGVREAGAGIAPPLSRLEPRGAPRDGGLPESFPARATLVVMAGTLALAFAAGVFVGRLSSSPPEDAPTASAPVASSGPPPQAPAPSARVLASAPSADALEPPEPPESLPPTEGWLLVTPAREDAAVYVGGRYAGASGQMLRVPCGNRFVRLGTHPLSRWMGRGRSIQVACRDVTRVELASR